MASEPGGSPSAPWLVRSTSPVHFLVAFAAAAALQWTFPLPLPEGGLRSTLHIAGTVLANTGLVLALWCTALFVRRRTTILPAQAPSRLIIRGPYRLSRNPFYVSLVAAYAGLALMLDVPWALALMPAPLLALQRVIIPFEEAGLRAGFGADYAAYQARVRRWF